ncbi:hypothetical protein BSK59_16050 [Paenibacillus odorifer]|uniref:hypothetical protein n=1 Tax=Paenibacillus odorifer TaxID=189426 RepID=UPI00096F8CC2|nr:hypothetical protein [Paenibacillus odorifer]OME54092.1 hypothetical protein BSK59_16050 [Paenibacillus odorifer]
MARISVKSRNRYKLDLNEKEMNTLTIALALLDIPTMEQEMKEQGLNKAEYDHLALFKTLTDVTGLYPQVQLPDDLNSIFPISPLMEDETA